MGHYGDYYDQENQESIRKARLALETEYQESTKTSLEKLSNEELELLTFLNKNIEILTEMRGVLRLLAKV